MKKIFIYIRNFIIISIILVLALFLTCLIPNKYMTENVKETAKITKSETWLRKIGTKTTDNYSEELMVNIAYSIDNKTPFYSMITAKRNYIDGVTTNIYLDTKEELYVATDYDGKTGTTELEALTNRENIDSYEYTRYWHGYLIILRPLLLLCNINEIRFILWLILMSLIIIMLILIKKKLGIKYMIIYAICLLGIDITIMGFTMQGVYCFLIGIIFNIILLKQKQIDMKKIINMFMITRYAYIFF